MTISAAERQRRARARRRRGGKSVNLEIRDWDTWVEILREDKFLHGADTPGAVAAATTAYLFEVCRRYRKEQAETELADIRLPVVGIMAREEPASVAEWKLTSDKKGTPVKKAKDVFYYVPDHVLAEMSKRHDMTRVRKNGRELYVIGGARDAPEPGALSEDELLDLFDEAARDRDEPPGEWDEVEAEAAAFEHGMSIETKD